MNLRDFIFEAPEPSPAELEKTEQVKSVIAITAPPPVNDSGDDSLYSGVLQATRPEDFPNLKKICDLARPLESIIPDQTTRYRAVWAQASAQGVSVAAIREEQKALYEKLETESHRGMELLCLAKNEAENSIATVTQQYQQLGSKLETLKAAAAKYARKEADFKTAIARRRAELDTMQKQFQLGA